MVGIAVSCRALLGRVRPAIGLRIRTAVHKGGVRSLRLLARKKAQLSGALSSDRSLSVAMQEGVE